MSTTQTAETTTPKEVQRLENIVAKGKNGEREIAISIQEYLQDNPEIYEAVGNLTSEVKEQIINHTVYDDYSKMALSHHVEALKVKLVGDQPLDVLESLLVDEVIIAYMLLRASDLMMVRHQHHLTGTDARKNSQYSTRFTRACGSLAKYRKMSPSIHINLKSEKQIVNIDR